MTNQRQADFLGPPDHFMLGTFGQESEAEAAFRELTERGFREDQVALCLPPEQIDSSGQEHGPLARIERLVERELTNKNDLAELST